MDRDWMTADQRSDEFEEGVKEFVAFAKAFADSSGEDSIFCPCKGCWNLKRVKISELESHLLSKGIDPSYKVWYWHGEKVLGNNNTEEYVEADANKNCQNDIEVDDDMIDMLHGCADNFTKRPDILCDLLSDAEKPLYPGCTKFSRLSGVLKLFQLKAKNLWSDKSFTELLELLHEMFPEGNVMPTRTKEAKKLLCPMGVEYKKIHACPNDCMLFRGDKAGLDECPDCHAPRYKLKENGHVTTKGGPRKVLWYLPIIPRLKRMFSDPKEAKKLSWLASRKVVDNKLRHPVDSPQWKTIDYTFPEFGKEPRNLRLGLCTDGLNPHSNLSSKHSTWPVLLVIYNLPSSMCMKRKHIMLTLLISGPRQPGNNIDVYLEPLVDDLKKLWEEGVLVFDAYRQESFTLHAMIFCTINDFPAYGNLSGYSVKGHKACPICEDRTCSYQLKHGRKTIYMGHRRHLRRDHPYRRRKKAFNGSTEEEVCPLTPLTGEEIHEKVKNICEDVGETKRPTEKTNWKRKSIFFEKLPYWPTLFVRHAIDVMHVEKNICDSIIGTLLNIPGKTKDGIKARMDMVDMEIRKELAPEKKGQRTYLPPACHTLSKAEKKSFCECLSGIKVPRGYSSNISRLVSMKDLKLVGMKSHDCHTLMQQLLPVAIRGILPKQVRHAITRLCLFFNELCSKVIDPSKLEDLEKEVVETLCQLEMHFPPAFFDIMVHLPAHLARETRLLGPVYFHWMFPFERYMKVLKDYVRNHYRPEGCMVEGYIAEEVLEYCANYLSNTTPIGVPKCRLEGRREGKGSLGPQMVSVCELQRNQVHLYILHNLAEVDPYEIEHQNMIRKQNPKKLEKWVQEEHNRTFSEWFSMRIDKELKENPKNVSETLRWLAPGPNVLVFSYRAYDINGYSFYTKSQDDRSTMQNSGVYVVAEAMHVSSSKDKNPVNASQAYYGYIEDIWEVDYEQFTVAIFKCNWVENIKNGVMDEGFTVVDLSKKVHKKEPFIMASQVNQVFYVTDPANEKLSIVLQGKRQHFLHDDLHANEDDDETNLDIEHIPAFSSGLPIIDNQDDEEDIYVRDDHVEGIWIDNALVPEQ